MNLSSVAKGFAGLALVWLACESKEKKPAKPLPMPPTLPVPPTPPAPPAPSPSGSAGGTGPTGQVWTHENRTSSDGKTAYYRQQYRTRSLGLREKFARVDVIGHGLQVRFDQNGRLLRVHPNDVRPIAPGEIDERMKVPWADAVRLARQKLKKELDAFKQFPPKTETEARRRYALLLCEAFRKKVTRYERNLVVMDDGKALSYAIDLRFGVFYVNTRETLDPDKVIFESRILF